MKNININEPCHENWAEMTPTQQGAFCSKCSINVVDFSNKTKDEIKLILLKNKGGMCGRLKQTQIDELNADFEAWKAQQPKTFQSRFVFALLMVFGLTLFSCNEEEAAVIQEMSINHMAMTNQVIEVKTELEPAREITELQPIQYVDSEFILQSEEITEINCELTVDVLGEVKQPDYDIMVAGGLSWSPEYEEHILETIPYADTITEEKELTQEEIDLANLPKFEANLFPNPTRDLSTLDLKVVEARRYDINLYDINGQMIRQIHSGNLSEGEMRFQIDVSDLQTGHYLIVIISEGEKETLKLQKVK